MSVDLRKRKKLFLGGKVCSNDKDGKLIEIDLEGILIGTVPYDANIANSGFATNSTDSETTEKTYEYKLEPYSVSKNNMGFLNSIYAIDSIVLTNNGENAIQEIVRNVKKEILNAKNFERFREKYIRDLRRLRNICDKFNLNDLKTEIEKDIDSRMTKEEKQKQREELKKKKMGKKGIKLSRKKKKEEYNFKLSDFKNPELTGDEAWRYKFVDGTGDNAFICTYETLNNFSETLGGDVKILVSATNNKGTGEKNYIIIELDKKIFNKLKIFAKKNPDRFRVMNKIEQPNNSLIQRGKAEVQSLWKKTNVIRDGGEQIANTVHGKIKHLISKTKIELKDTLYEMAEIMRLEELFKERKNLSRFTYPYEEDKQQK